MGAYVNLEVDVLAKYVERLVAAVRLGAAAADAPVGRGAPDGRPGEGRGGVRVRWTRRSPASATGASSSSSTTRSARTRAIFVIAAERVTPEAINFMSKHARGLITVPLTAERLAALDLPANGDAQYVAPGHGVHGVGRGAAQDQRPGISAHDRAATIRALVDPETQPGDLSRPGHVFPLRATPGGVLRRAGHTEAAVDLASLAGLQPAGVLCEIMNEDGTMSRLPQLAAFAARHGLPILSVRDLIRYRLLRDRFIQREGQTRLPDARRGVHRGRVRERARRREPPRADRRRSVRRGARAGAYAVASA